MNDSQLVSNMLSEFRYLGGDTASESGDCIVPMNTPDLSISGSGITSVGSVNSPEFPEPMQQEGLSVKDRLLRFFCCGMK